MKHIKGNEITFLTALLFILIALTILGYAAISSSLSCPDPRFLWT